MKNSTEKIFKILIVDDNPDNIQVIGNILRDAGYSIGYATNGQQAIHLLQKTKDYDLVMLDVDMPLMNGYETCRAIRGNNALKEIPVVFLTASKEVENIVQGFDAGAQDYLTKPFHARELLARVNTHLLLKYKTDQVNLMNQMLEEKNSNITDSIVYASRIQQALLPSIQILAEKIPTYFLLNKPKDIVSGDFYWFRQTGNYLYVAVADCTGHGVPGAFMSVLGISALNKIIKDQEIISPNNILSELKNSIIESLWKQAPDTEIWDGIDLSLCLINFDDHSLQFAGAFRPLLLIRKNPVSCKYDMMEIKPDQIPIGLYPDKDKKFTNHLIPLHDGDAVYLFSDGFISQIGGGITRKFFSKQLRELLLNIQEEPMEIQKQLLEKAHDDWKGTLLQTDDILVIGLKINYLYD